MAQPVMPASHTGGQATQLLIHLPFNAPEETGRWTKCLDPFILVGNPESQAPSFGLPSPGHYTCLGSQSINRWKIFSLSLSLALSPSLSPPFK